MSWLSAILGWFLGLFVNANKKEQLEKKYVEAKKENLKLRARLAVERKRVEQKEQAERDRDEWNNATDEEKQTRILRRFDKR